MRLSLVGTGERYEKGILELYDLLKSGKDKSVAIKELGVKYPEREVEALYDRISKLKQVKPYSKLKKFLKILLWFFLLLKIFAAITIILESGWSPWTSLIMLILVPILNIIALYLMYSKKGYAYEMIFLLVLLSFNGMMDLLRSAFEAQSVIEISFAVVLIVASIALVVTTYILRKNQPMELGVLLDIIKKHNLDFNAYV